MRSRAKRGMFEGMHVYDTNYISGNLKDYRNIRWAHMDGDDDGVADAIDLHFRFGSVDPALPRAPQAHPRYGWQRSTGIRYVTQPSI